MFYKRLDMPNEITCKITRKVLWQYLETPFTINEKPSWVTHRTCNLRGTLYFIKSIACNYDM